MKRTILLLMVVGAAVLVASGVVLAQTSSPHTFATKWGTSGIGNGQFNNPQGVATDSLGNVYVVDHTNENIQKFDSNGNFLTKWGTGPGLGDGQFNLPYSVATDSLDNVYVADTGNNRIQKFAPPVAVPPPAEPSTPDLDAASDSGAISTDNLTNDVTPTFVGTAEANSTVKIYVDGEENESDPATAEGTYSITTSALDPGNRSVTATASNATGESPPSGALNITIDTQAPEMTIDSGPSDPTNSATATFAFSSSEAGSTFECRLDGAASFSACASGQEYTGLSDGSHTFEVKATDAAGNTDLSPASHTFTIDTQAPETTIDSPPLGTTNDSTPTFEFSSNESGSTFECKLDSGSFESCSSPKTYETPLQDGSHTFQVRAIDAAGNTDSTPASQSFTVDALAPSPPTITSPTNNSYTTGSFSVQGTADTGTTVELFEGSTSVGTARTGRDGSWTINLRGVAEGTHTYTAKATKAGHTSGPSDSLTVVVDNTKPSVDSVTPSASEPAPLDTLVTATFSEEMNPSTLTSSTVTLVDAKKKQVPASVSYASNTVTLDPNTDLAPNSKYTATITTGAKDPAGNALARSFRWTFTTVP